MPSPEELRKHGAAPIVTRLKLKPQSNTIPRLPPSVILNSSEAQLLLDGAFYVSSEIERITDFEKGFPGAI